MSSPRRLLVPLALALLVGAAAPRAAHAGPPWISVELPVNPHDPATRGALAVVHLYHHETSTPWPLDAQAVGLVDGQRRTVRLDATSTAAGRVVVRGTLPRGEGWVLVLTMQAGASSRASALVALDRRGDVASLRVPVDTIENGRWVVPRAARDADVNAMLRLAAGGARLAAADAAPSPTERGGLAIAGVGLTLLAPFARRLTRR